MHYGTILHLIELELERLWAARRVLTEDSAVAALGSRAAESTNQPAASVALAASAPEHHAATPAAHPVQARVLKPRSANGPTRRARIVRVAPEPRALASSVPAAPVAVSAAHVQHQRETAAQEAAAAQAAGEPAPVAEGTLESLLRDLQVRGTAA